MSFAKDQHDAPKHYGICEVLALRSSGVRRVMRLAVAFASAMAAGS